MVPGRGRCFSLGLIPGSTRAGQGSTRHSPEIWCSGPKQARQCMKREATLPGWMNARPARFGSLATVMTTQSICSTLLTHARVVASHCRLPGPPMAADTNGAAAIVSSDFSACWPNRCPALLLLTFSSVAKNAVQPSSTSGDPLQGFANPPAGAARTGSTCTGQCHGLH